MRISLCWLLICGSLFAQDSTTATATIVSAGYSAPSLNFAQAAPGQMISLMVYGLDHRLDQPVAASGTPLPTMLANFSVSSEQGTTTLPVPLLGISQAPCTLVAPMPLLTYPSAIEGLCQSLTIISIQVPFEVHPECRVCGYLTIPGFFVVSDAGVPKAFISTSFPADNIHITNPCDTTAMLSQVPDVACGKIVVHADGAAD